LAALIQPYWNRVSPLLREILIGVRQCPFIHRFYLAGGTALALQLGHRVSVDLDFFSTSDELGDASRREIITALQDRFSLDVVENVFSTLVLNVQGISVGFFSYSYRLLAPAVMVKDVSLAGLLDIGLMKMDAIATRGARKDFYDLYFIAQHIALEDMLERAKDKYPYVRDFGIMVLAALGDFENADHDVPIESYPPVSWDKVKDFFVQEVRRIGRQWFEPQ
jgi:hypothetical protein